MHFRMGQDTGMICSILQINVEYLYLYLKANH